MANLSYSYLKMGSFYLCLEENPFKLAWLLYSKTKPFNFDLEAKSNIKPLRAVPKHILKFYRVLRLVTLCSLRKRGLLAQQLKTMIKLPEHGHIAFALQAGGYKVCDLDREVVVTKYPVDLDIAVVAERAEKSIKVGKFMFAPTVLHWSVEERRLEEEYINGCWTLPVYPGWDAIHQHFMPLLEAMLAATPSRVVNLKTYVDEVQEIASGLEDAFPASESSRERLHAIREFLARTCRRVLDTQVQEISLAMSHGDLWRGNLLVAADRIVAVDWQTLEFRSPLHDLHSLFFRTLMGALPTDKKPTVAEMALEMERATSYLKARIEKQSPELASRLFLPLLTNDIHRWVFYLELLKIALKDFQGAKDHHEVRLSGIIKFIGLFDRFENMLGLSDDHLAVVASQEKAAYAQEAQNVREPRASLGR